MAKPHRARHQQHPNLDQRKGRDYQPSSPREPVMRVGNGEREPLIHTDMREPFVLTGQWREANDRYHLFINQAGEHLELLLALVDSNTSAMMPVDEAHLRGDAATLPDARRLIHCRLRMYADIDASLRTHYHLFARVPGSTIAERGPACGWLRRNADGSAAELELELDDLDLDPRLRELLQPLMLSKARRLSTRPNLFENYLDKPWIPEALRTMAWFPTTPEQHQALPKFILAARVRAHRSTYEKGDWEDSESFAYTTLVEEYFNIGDAAYYEALGEEPPGARQLAQRRENIASTLNDLVGIAYANALQAPPSKGGIDHSQRHEFAAATIATLEEHQVMFDTTWRSYLTHTHHILDQSSKDSRSVRHFIETLGLDWKLHGGRRYDAKLVYMSLEELTDDAEGIKDFKKYFAKQTRRAVKKNGTKLKRRFPLSPISIIGELSVSNEQDLPFSATYLLVALGLTASKSKDIGWNTKIITTTGTADNIYGPAWKPENIPGAAFIADGGAYFSSIKGKGAGLTVLFCKGGGKDKPPGMLPFNFSGLSDIVSSGAGVGLSATTLVGKIFPIVSGDDDLEELPEADAEPEYADTTNSRATVHFPINGSMPFPDGLWLLQVFAACELAVLGQKGVELELRGYADQPHGALENQILSRNRAVSVYQYLKNILGDELSGPAQLKEIPDEKAEIEKIKGKQDNKSWNEKNRDPNTTFSIFDPSIKNITITAYGESTSSSTSYNQESRRTDVFVNGEVRLRLERSSNDK
ncbi:hypothetical protein G6O69_07505 [Pseudenhygromyxa sp. WMMC2535]|uniref:hypothetical protein n=1 Tax=Pseudenhygromyxa sp. WMMC2535 TaxID=2712867 RepID=UPI001557241D|nr:hypothetical protein [Pseudenhygromyxa sp. WMMC2535]NVB37674.1 hypothetical protein [Pseudenhygromyxa sp. WMMC2535]